MKVGELVAMLSTYDQDKHIVLFHLNSTADDGGDEWNVTEDIDYVTDEHVEDEGTVEIHITNRHGWQTT